MVSLLNLLDFSIRIGEVVGAAGWTKIRDVFVIPFAVQIGLYIGKQILQTVAA